MNSDSATRRAAVSRSTGETEVVAELGLDGTGVADIETPVPFFTHMLQQWTWHSRVDLTLRATDRLGYDDHHVVEDVAIVIGTALDRALGDREGIERYGSFSLIMDDTVATAALDLSGRSSLIFDASFDRDVIGGLATEMVEHFWSSFALHARCNLWLKAEYGRNTHHRVEALFKAAGRVVRMASAPVVGSDSINSTKGKVQW